MTDPILIKPQPRRPGGIFGGTLGGIFLRLGATALFAVMSVFVRLASFEAPVGQIMFWRSAVALLPIVAYLMICGQFPSALRTTRPAGHVHRSLLGCASMFFSFLSLAYLPLALATALGFVAPLMVVPAAILLLKEKPSWLVALAAVAGFGGVAIMLIPTMQGPTLDTGTLIGIGAGLAMAATTVIAKIQIKTLTATEHPGTIAFYFAVVCSLIGLASYPLGWAQPDWTTYGWLIGAGLLGGLAHIAMTEAVARAPVSTLAPFEYTAMLWAFGLDLAVFGLAPTWLGIIGAVVIVLAAATVAIGEKLTRKVAG